MDIIKEESTKPIKKETHMTLNAIYEPRLIYFIVPKHWNLDEIDVRYDIIYYKGVNVNDYLKRWDIEHESKFPEQIIVDDDGGWMDEYYDCE